MRYKRLELDQKAGFRNVGSSPIVIYDEVMRPFYDTSLLANKVREFNLPPGEYYVISGKFNMMASPVVYPLKPMPEKQRHMPQNPEFFPINYVDKNPNLATINWDNNTIFLDKSMRSLTWPELIFIMYHEYGHRFYHSESACDAYARNRMLREGYNPSQIAFAIVETLSDNNHKRKELMVESMINTNALPYV